MAQSGYVFKAFGGWHLRYREDAIEAGKLVRKQKCVKLADVCDRYRCESDLDELRTEKLADIRRAAKCPQSSTPFVAYVEDVYMPFVKRTMKPSTYAGYSTYWNRYLKP